MSDAPGQEVRKPKGGRTPGDKGTKKLHAVATDKVATTHAFGDAVSQVRKLLTVAERNNREGSGTFKTGWAFAMTVEGGDGVRKVQRTEASGGPGRSVAALVEPQVEAVAACFGGTDPQAMAHLWEQASQLPTGVSSGEYKMRGCAPTKFTLLRNAEDGTRFFDDEKHVKPPFASVAERDRACEQALGREGNVNSQFPMGSPPKPPAAATPDTTKSKGGAARSKH